MGSCQYLPSFHDVSRLIVTSTLRNHDRLLPQPAPFIAIQSGSLALTKSSPHPDRRASSRPSTSTTSWPGSCTGSKPETMLLPDRSSEAVYSRVTGSSAFVYRSRRPSRCGGDGIGTAILRRLALRRRNKIAMSRNAASAPAVAPTLMPALAPGGKSAWEEGAGVDDDGCADAVDVTVIVWMRVVGFDPATIRGCNALYGGAVKVIFDGWSQLTFSEMSFPQHAHWAPESHTMSGRPEYTVC